MQFNLRIDLEVDSNAGELFELGQLSVQLIGFHVQVHGNDDGGTLGLPPIDFCLRCRSCQGRSCHQHCNNNQRYQFSQHEETSFFLRND